MTPKEKAEEITLKYYNLAKHLYIPMSFAKQCSLIAVDEIILTCAFNDYKTKKYFEHCNYYDDSYFCTYWKEVKQEIQKL